MFVNALCVSMGALLIITLKTTIHQKRKRLLPRCNNERRGKVHRERKGEQRKKVSIVGAVTQRYSSSWSAAGRR